MLSEAELQELRGIAFDRLLLQLWPKWNPNRAPACTSCGSSDLHCRGLCLRCYERWRWGQRSGKPLDIEALPARYDAKRYQDILLARRIGIGLSTLRSWRNGRAIPRIKTDSPVARNLEMEFGVPVALWCEAAAVSLSTVDRSWFVEDAITPSLGRRFGYWLVIKHSERRHGTYVRALCLLCLLVSEKSLADLRTGRRGQCCKTCSSLLPDWRPLGASGFKGVYRCQQNNSYRGQWKIKKAGRPTERRFTDSADAARYYDACMYERYGHTLFLNFPGEYDRSNDPVFVPVGRDGHPRQEAAR